MHGQGIGKAVAVIQHRPVTGALAVSTVGIEGDIGNMGRVLRNDHAALEQVGIQRQDGVVARSSEQNDPGLKRGGGAVVGSGAASINSLKRRLSVSLFMTATSAEVSMIIRPEDPIRHNQ